MRDGNGQILDEPNWNGAQYPLHLPEVLCNKWKAGGPFHNEDRGRDQAKGKPMRIYMEVTRDKYEFPINIEDSAKRLAEKCGVTANAVTSSCSHHRNGLYKRSRFVSVDIEEEE